MTTNVCDAKSKCKIWLDNYKYFLKQTCFQTSPILCIQFSFILNLKGSIKEIYNQVFSSTSCQHIRIHNVLIEQHQIWICTHLYLKKN
jgi:hypothetical protein